MDTKQEKPKHVMLHTTYDENFGQRLYETARATGVPVDKLREMVDNFHRVPVFRDDK
jgi:hypothetical protein